MLFADISVSISAITSIHAHTYIYIYIHALCSYVPCVYVSTRIRIYTIMYLHMCIMCILVDVCRHYV